MNVKVVEFRDGRPFTVVVEGEYGYRSYDFEWSKQSECYLYHDSSGGSKSWTITEDEFWAAPDARFEIYPGCETKRRDEFDSTSLFSGYENIECDSIEYCSQCEDWTHCEPPCVHLHWHDEFGYFVEVTYCCNGLIESFTRDFNVDTGKIENWSDEYDTCPFCGGLPTFKENG